jgi:hypothetical protein
MIVEELDQRMSSSGPHEVQVTLPSDFKEQIRRHLPALLADDDIKQHLFAVIAYEMIVNPGLLGELAGIRGFLRSEVRQLLGEFQANTTRPEMV